MIQVVRLVATVTLSEADTVLPCTTVGNPIWETERATCHGQLTDRKVMFRKIKPIVNGISNMGLYQPDYSLELPEPTVTMLSHVVMTKDIKNAIFSWDIIVNQFKQDRLYLDIYGSTDKVAWYTQECDMLITSLNLKVGTFCMLIEEKCTIKRLWRFKDSPKESMASSQFVNDRRSSTRTW